MAKIVENQTGRRIIRLSTEDVLTVVTLYQQQMHRHGQPKNYTELKSRLGEHPFYLPEEV